MNIVVQYSDHDRRLILVVDDHEKGQTVARDGMRETWPGMPGEEAR